MLDIDKIMHFMLIQKSTGNSMNYKLDCLSQDDIICISVN